MDNPEKHGELLHAKVATFDVVTTSPDKALVSVRGRITEVCTKNALMYV